MKLHSKARWTASILGLLAVAVIVAGCATRPHDCACFGDWPAGASPAVVGKRVAERFLAVPLLCETQPGQAIHYREVCAAYGSLTIAKLTRDSELKQRLVHRFEFLLTPDGAKSLPQRAHVDDRVFGVVPLEIYLQTGDDRFLALGKSFADAQWKFTTPDGITTEARYWVDDMYMISTLQVQAYRATREAKYLDRASQAMVAYLDQLQQPNGLFFHSADSPCYWSRGNGWYAAGMTEILTELPKNHPNRARIMKGFQTMMASLLKYQSAEGRWHQLIDRPESWLESSGTGMFAYAMVTGVKRGWLDAETYGPAARKAWLSLVDHLNADADIEDVCIGTGKAFTEVGGDPARQIKYYIDRPRIAGDLHGQAPILWTAAALLKK